MEAEAEVPLLAQLPMEMPVMHGGDEGRPAVLSAPTSVTAQAFLALAGRVCGLAGLAPTPA